MRDDCRIVSPYRPFEPESQEHLRLGAFDWPGALKMLHASAARSAAIEVVALTDETTELPLPALRYVPRCHRLMPWILDVSLAYLESGDFDRDTWFISPDMLVLADPASVVRHKADLIIMTRQKHGNRAILNAVQFWRAAARKKLIAFYRQCYERALALDEETLRWGADTEPLAHFLAPILTNGAQMEKRMGMNVLFLPLAAMCKRISEGDLKRTDRGSPGCPIAEFTYMRKTYMKAFYEKLLA